MAIYKSEEQYLAENPDVAAAVEAGDFATGAQHYLQFGEREILEGRRSPTAEYTPPSTGITQEQLAAEIAKLPAPVVQGGGSSTTTITGPTQAEMIKAFQDAQDTSGIMSAIGTRGTDTEEATGLFKPLTNLQSQIGQAAIPGTEETQEIAPTGLFAGQADLQTGQAGIMSNIGQAGTASQEATGLYGGQANILGNQGTITANQAAIGGGVSGLQQAVGQAAGVEEDGVTPTAPTGLFAGQAGLVSGQQQLGRNITGELGGLGSDLASFRTAAEAYQRQAETARGDIQGTQRAGQSELERQIGGVGLASNRAAEMLTQQRQAEALAARQARSVQQPAVQQQAAQFARSAPRATTSNQQVGPMGPMATDPRDAIMRQLMANRTGLMNRGPV
jgi:hypothetical protein